MPYVYAFDHKHRRPPMDLKDLLGGKGANLAEMTSVLELPVPPGFTITTDACRAYMHGGWPAGLDEEIAKQVFRLEKKMGRKLGDPVRPAAGQRALGRQVLHARDDGHGPEPRAQRPERRRAWPTSPSDERFAYDSYRRFIAMYGRIVLDIEGAPVRRAASRRPRPGPASPPTTRSRPRRCAELAEEYKAGRATRDGQALPAEARATSSAAPSRRCSAAGTAPGPWPTACASASATTWARP